MRMATTWTMPAWTTMSRKLWCVHVGFATSTVRAFCFTAYSESLDSVMKCEEEAAWRAPRGTMSPVSVRGGEGWRGASRMRLGLFRKAAAMPLIRNSYTKEQSAQK